MEKIATHSYRGGLINRLIQKRDVKINRILKNVRKDANMKERERVREIERQTDRQKEREKE